jgi:hypothetical protein
MTIHEKFAILKMSCFSYSGKNVLNQKSELQRALEKHKEHQVKKELEHQRQESKSALERVIEERARRLETVRSHVGDHRHWGPLLLFDTYLFNFSQCSISTCGIYGEQNYTRLTSNLLLFITVVSAKC